ncbi:OmpA family protein [Biostraticola tofi]|uniref:Outer membrane protein OmpA-like peptidoglycan-associated protein n=1 Tax=Biostraticola tofi TaxID=466109 RepID=A0A4R3Z2Y6_9GAMM|nr:OmpA family protein [Biostraticola tofi]TCW00162.1 outer membrane protein OmpA-like peptidoglycan-associated protein [Biostraticola tofi]
MSIALKRALWLAGCALAWILCLLWFPVGMGAKTACSLVILLAAATAWFRIGHGVRALRAHHNMDALLAALPADSWRQPVVLTAGEGHQWLFAGAPLRETPQGCYILVPTLADLASMAEMLLSARPEWASQLSGLLVLFPEQQDDQPVLAAQIGEFRYQLSRIRQLSGHRCQALLACYLNGRHAPWFACSAGNRQTRVWSSPQSSQALDEWLEGGSTQQQDARLREAVRVEAWVRWMSETVLPQCETADQPCAPLRPLAAGLAFVARPPKDSNLWHRWIAGKTTLRPVTINESADGEAVRFPDPLLSLLPGRSGYTPRLRAIGYVIIMLMVFMVAALAGSSWNNRQLLREIASDMERYQAIAMDNYPSKAEALAQLKTDAALLERYHRNGVPVRLGLWLYPGEQIYPPLMALIRGYQPAPEPVKEAVKAPETVRLDSMSLFEVGKSELKAGSTKVLVDALINIKGRPGWIVLITGHTDATGDAKANMALSLARAEAVRDWMIKTSDISASCFAVQGYGATRPVATNSTPAGRAANRRVELSLVPDAMACQPAATGTDTTLTSPDKATSHSK